MGDELVTYLFGVSSSVAATEASVAPVVAAEATKAAAGGATAVTNAAQMPGPMAFVGAAAMIALLAGIGVMLGGGGTSVNLSAQRQSSQGTGSVFGDNSAKSESITKALENISENSDISEIPALLSSVSVIKISKTSEPLTLKPASLAIIARGVIPTPFIPVK
jgi:hypothetical protein